jgi:hypothetical protein
MSRGSHGSGHAMHGVNPGADRLQHLQAGLLRFGLRIEHTPCPYDQHRPSDWRLDDRRLWVCGVCHPPPRDGVQKRAHA